MPGSLLKDPIAPNKDGHEMYIDIGVYGLPRCVHEKREEDFDMKKSMRKVISDLKDLNGFQMLYADVFSSREEFEQMFDHEGYRKIRNKYKADTGVFKEVYDKMSVLV
jgi:delta24-sterol reductase